MNMNSLDSYKQNFIKSASGLKNYDKLNEYELVEGYCNAEDSGDELLRNQYYSALMLRYWYKIYSYIETCKFLRLEDVEYISWLAEALDIVFRYRSWRNSGKDISKDPKAVDKIINRCCFSIKGYHFQEINKDKRKLNYLCNYADEQEEKFGDSTYRDSAVVEQKGNFVEDIIEKMLNNNNYLEAIIIDNIAYQDSFRQIKTVNTVLNAIIKESKESDDEEQEDVQYELVKQPSYNYNFDKKKLKRNLSNLNDNYLKYFCKKYLNKSNENNFKEYFNKFVEKKTSSKLNLAIDRTLCLMKKNIFNFIN